MNLQASYFILLIICFSSRFGLLWFAKRIIVTSNDTNEDTLFSLNQQVHCKTVVFMNYWWFENYRFHEGPVHITPEEFENAALFLRLGLPSTLIRHENGALRKRPSDRRDLKTPALRFSVDENNTKTELFVNDDITAMMRFRWPSFLHNKSKMTSDCCVFKRENFYGAVWTGLIQKIFTLFAVSMVHRFYRKHWMQQINVSSF